MLHAGLSEGQIPRPVETEGRREDAMRFIHLFLVGYFILVIGLGLALWQTGVLSRVAPIWIGIVALVAIGLGIMLAVTSGRPDISEEVTKRGS